MTDTIRHRPAFAQARQINLAGASYDMREAILGEFGKRTGITPRPFVNPSTQVRVDRLRTAPVDCVLVDAPFAAYAQGEKLDGVLSWAEGELEGFTRT